jgi:two-component system, NarL family, response regulator DegU
MYTNNLSQKPLHIGIVNDHRLMRKSLALCFKNTDRMRVSLEAENADELFPKLSGSAVDLLLLDLQMARLNAYDTCLSIRRSFPKLRILAISHVASLPGVVRAVESGVNGFLSKYSDPDDLPVAIQEVMKDHFYLDPALGYKMKDILSFNKKKRSKSASPGTLFTEREISILKMACQEYSSMEIADKLFINVKTVDSHRKRIMEKTASKNFIGAIMYAIRHDYISIPY